MILLKKTKSESIVMAEGSMVDILTELTFCIGELYARMTKGLNPLFATAFKHMLQHCFDDDSPVFNVGLDNSDGCCIVTDKKALRKALEEEGRGDQ